VITDGLNFIDVTLNMGIAELDQIGRVHDT